MTKAAYVLGLIGGIMLIIGSMIALFLTYFLFAFIAQGQIFPGFELSWISVFLTLGLGITAVISSVKMKKGKKWGSKVLLFIGVFSAVGLFIQIAPDRIIDMGAGLTFPAPAVVLNTSFLYVDPYIIICGAIIELLAVQEDTVSAKDYSIISLDDKT